jgi:hypothetical protein
MKWLRRELVTMLRSGELLAVHRDELCVMQRRRSVPHTFEENIAAEKAKLEALIAKLKRGPQEINYSKKIRQLETASHMSEWLACIPDLVGGKRGADVQPKFPKQ